MSLRFRGVSA
jgi:hypothetical protein